MSTTHAFGDGSGKSGWWSGGLSTLLGPEGSVAPLGGGELSSGPVPVTFGWLGRGYRPYVENFTVDASIFVVHNKLLRAIGGCLGTKSR